MRARRTVALAVVALAALSGCAGDEASDEGGLIQGNLGALDFLATPLAPPAEGANSFEVRLYRHGSTEPLEGAELDVQVVMPSMGHEAHEEPRIEEASPGLYEVSGIVFSMAGTWEVRYRAARSALHDEAAFRYEVR